MENLVLCKICNEMVSRIYGAHLKKHGITSNEYKKLYPGCPLMSSKDLSNTIKNSGKHMKDEKYKKMFSEMFSGEKNPNHTSRTTNDERKSRSPFSKQFVKYEGIENKEEVISSFVKEAIKDRKIPSQKEYWITRGFSEEESILKVSEYQSTFSLEKCIGKYGKKLGTERWKDRQTKWQSSLLLNGNLKCGYSKVSQELFNEIKTFYKKVDQLYYATHNKEYYISISGSFFVYDFVDLSKKKIIEYNGDNYHANPKMFNENSYPHPFYKENGPTASEIWEKDRIKIDTANNHGFDVLVIWDSEYKSNKKEIIDKCLNFLKS